VEELLPYLQGSWVRIKQELVSGRCQLPGVRLVETVKAGGGKQQLRMPTVVDQMILQAVQQVVKAIYAAAFSE